MNRFKFRLWDGKKYHFGCFVVLPSGKWGVPVEFPVVDGGILEQCTGAKDQSGRLVYEGDVVKVYSPLTDKWDVCVVQWSNDSAGWVCLYLDPGKVVRGCSLASRTGTYFDGSYCYVVGNINEWKGEQK